MGPTGPRESSKSIGPTGAQLKTRWLCSSRLPWWLEAFLRLFVSLQVVRLEQLSQPGELVYLD